MADAADAPARSPYRKYWVAWCFLLVLTVLMVWMANPTFLVAGMIVKATVIALIFMHLRSERFDFGLIIAIGTLATVLLLFGLLIPDGLAA